MPSLATPSTRVKITAYIVMGAYSLAFLVLGISLPHGAARLLSYLPVLVLALFALFDNWAWKNRFILPLVAQPLLDGTWHGTLISYRRDKHDKKITSEHQAILVIRQSFTGLSITQMTAESKSRSSTAQIITKQKGDYVVQYQYGNEPKLEYRDQSPSHVGGSCFDVAGPRPTLLEGEYWTARDSKGTYKMTRVSDQHASSFDAGLQMAKSTA